MTYRDATHLKRQCAYLRLPARARTRCSAVNTPLLKQETNYIYIYIYIYICSHAPSETLFCHEDLLQHLCNFPPTPLVHSLVGQLVGWSVWYNFLKWHEVTLQCFYVWALIKCKLSKQVCWNTLYMYSVYVVQKREK